MKLYFCFIFFVFPLLTKQNYCSTPSNWTIDFNDFELSNYQFDDDSENVKLTGKSCSGLEWVDATVDNWKTIEQAVHLNTNCPDVICRCTNCGEDTSDMLFQAFPGSVDAETGICHVPWFRERNHTEYQVLTNPCGFKLEWVPGGTDAEAPVVPSCAVVGGFEATAFKYLSNGLPPYNEYGSYSYVGRVEGDDGFLYGGKVQAVDELFYYPYHSEQWNSKSYEVLVLKEE